jgi:hypothetical protein
VRTAACLAAIALAWTVAHAEPTYYVNTERDAPAAFLTLDLAEDGTLHGRVLGDPARHGAMARTFEADVERAGDRVRATASAALAGAPTAGLTAEARWTTTAGEGDAWTLTVQAHVGGDDVGLDPFGKAWVTWPGAHGQPGGTARVGGIGEAVRTELRSGDRSPHAARIVPRFHAPPWRDLNIAATLDRLADARGDEQRGAPDDAEGGVPVRQVVRTTVLTDSLVSVLIAQYPASGDPVAPTALASRTWAANPTRATRVAAGVPVAVAATATRRPTPRSGRPADPASDRRRSPRTGVRRAKRVEARRSPAPTVDTSRNTTTTTTASRPPPRSSGGSSRRTTRTSGSSTSSRRCSS